MVSTNTLRRYAGIALSTLVLLLTVTRTPASEQSLVALNHWFSSSTNDHFYATTSDTPGGYTYQGITAYVYDGQASGTIPLHRWYNGSANHHFYTTSGDGPGTGWSYEGVCCYVLSSQVVGSVPLHRWYLSSGKHYYTTSSGSISGATYEGVEGYVSPAP